MSTILDPDVRASGSFLSTFEHLVGPLSVGAQQSEIAIDGTGLGSVKWEAREPLLVVAPRESLDTDGLVVTATLPDTSAVTLDLVRYTEAGAVLPLYRPPVDPGTRHATMFDVKLALAWESGAAVAKSGIASMLELRLIEGVMGRMLFVLSSEKARLRREARLLSAQRLTSLAQDDALDELGAELAVPRFLESQDDGSGSVTLVREADDDYRRRLGVYRPWLRPTRGRVLELLNGPGTDTDPNAGAMAGLGLTERFSVVDENNPFAVAVYLVAAGDAQVRDTFMQFVRAVHLIWPKTTAASNAAHAARFLPASRAQQEDDLRKQMRSLFDFVGDAATNPALAPMLATALIRAARCRQALGLSGNWELIRAQKPDGGSRYELGLGVAVTPFTNAELNTMRTKHGIATSGDPEIAGVLAGMQPLATSDDPDGAWMLQACGLRTVHRVDSSTLYLSHLPNDGLVVDGPNEVPAKGWAILAKGYFGERRMSGDLLLYDRSAGEGQFLGFSLEGEPNPLSSVWTGWRTTWSDILAGRLAFQARVGNGLLFYERASGLAAVYRVGQGLITYMGQTTTRKTWSILTVCDLNRTYESVFAYDRAAGEAEFLITDGQGALNRLGKTLTGQRTSWSAIVAGSFGGTGQIDLLFYDRRGGDAQIATTDGSGSLEPFADASWDDQWTHVVAGFFTGGERSDLFLYDSVNGVAEVRTCDEHGKLTLLARHENVPRGWTHVVAGDHGGEELLTLYDRIAGKAALIGIRADGGFVNRGRYTGWRKADGSTLESRYEAPGDPATNAVLAAGLSAASTSWTGAGNAAWTELDASTNPSQAQRWAQATAPNASTSTSLAAAGLPAIADPALAATQLGHLPAELVRTLDLPAALATQIRSGSAAGGAALRQLVDLLRANHLSAAVAMPTGDGGLVVVAAVTGLPQVGSNLADLPASGFRWYVVPLEGPGGQVQAVGSQTRFVPAGEGLSAVVAIGYARRGLADPYEFHVDLPDGVLLDGRQYEFVMNLLGLAYPLGVRVNTYALRKDHVDIDGDGQPDALDTTVSRTYRAFRRPRHLGATTPNLDKEPA